VVYFLFILENWDDMIQKDIQQKTIIIAEAGVNHNGSLDLALKMIDVAADAGADIIKFQTFKANQVISQNAPKADYQIRNTDASESQLEMAQKLELSHDAHHSLLQHCNKRKIEFLSSPFDMQSLQFLTSDLKLDRIKIGSGEITNFPMLLGAAHSGKKMILSSGMSTLGEVEAALEVIAYGLINKGTPGDNPNIFTKAFCSSEGQEALRRNVLLLHCVTEYPSNFADVNLQVIDTMQNAFGLPVGLSDHTLGIEVPIAAVARGAVIIEKHFTLDKNLEGPDHTASLDPKELFDMVRSIRNVEQSLGDGKKYPSLAETKNMIIVRRSLTALCGITKGEKFTHNNLTTKRPGTGISATQYWNYLGKISDRNYQKDEQIVNI
jgi:N-acetylneuraminate synthase